MWTPCDPVDQRAPSTASLDLGEARRERLLRLARDGYPFEACGLLLGRRGYDRVVVEEVTHGRNLEETRPAERYTLDPVHLMTTETRARAAGLEVVGVWHSHPDRPAHPSSADLEYAQEDWAYVIVSVSGDAVRGVRSWTLKGPGFVEQTLL